MAPAIEQGEVAGRIGRAVAGRITGALQRRLPLRWWDSLYQFWIQTRLIFSRTTILFVAAQFVFFSWMTTVEELWAEDEVFKLLTFQSLALAVLLNMNLWVAERSERTFELMLMRMPDTDHLIWLKFRVSLFWLFVLPMPFYLGFVWFLDVPPIRCLAYFVFLVSSVVPVALLTCVLSCFVRFPLATGIIAFGLSGMVLGITTELGEEFASRFTGRIRDIPLIFYMMPFLNPLFARREEIVQLKIFERAWLLIVNRLVLAAAIVALYF